MDSKCGPTGVLKNEEDQVMVTWTFGYVKCWVFNYSSTIKDESGITNSNQAYTFWEWNIKE